MRRLLRTVAKALLLLLILRLGWALLFSGGGTIVAAVVVYGLLGWVVWRALPACRADVARLRSWARGPGARRDSEGVRF